MDEVYEDILVAVHRAGRPVSRLEIELLTNHSRDMARRRCLRLVQEDLLSYNDFAARYTEGKKFPRGRALERMAAKVDKRREHDPLYRPDAFKLLLKFGNGYSYMLRQTFLKQLVELCRKAEAKGYEPDSLGELAPPAECSPEVELVYRRAHEVVSKWLAVNAMAEDFSDGAAYEAAGLSEEPPCDDLLPGHAIRSGVELDEILAANDSDLMPDEVLATLEPEYLDDE